MAWKEVESVKLYPGNAPFVAGAPLCGTRRVTVEEYVNECCEKWRGGAYSTHPLGKTGMVFCESVKFCPECGRKLEG